MGHCSLFLRLLGYDQVTLVVQFGKHGTFGQEITLFVYRASLNVDSWFNDA